MAIAITAKKNLADLQRVIALKTFGFSLTQIKEVLEDAENPLTCLKSQISVLESRILKMKRSLSVMQTIYTEHHNEKSIPWEKTLELIETYKV